MSKRSLEIISTGKNSRIVCRRALLPEGWYCAELQERDDPQRHWSRSIFRLAPSKMQALKLLGLFLDKAADAAYLLRSRNIFEEENKKKY